MVSSLRKKKSESLLEQSWWSRERERGEILPLTPFTFSSLPSPPPPPPPRAPFALHPRERNSATMNLSSTASISRVAPLQVRTTGEHVNLPSESLY